MQDAKIHEGDRASAPPAALRSLALACRAFPAPSRHLADARISGYDQLASVHRGFFKVGSVRGKDLPAGHSLPEHRYRAQVGKVLAQAGMMFLGSGEPDSVVGNVIGLVSENQN